MKTKLSARFWCAITLFSLIGQVAWVVENMYFNVFIYKMFNASAADISAMVAASAVAATLTTVFMGALSDRIGKRKLFICAGYILWGISIFSFVFLRLDIIEGLFPAAVSAASVGISLVIIFDCVMTFFGSTANDAAFNAWITDSTDDTNRGSVEGINAMMPLVAILVVFGSFMFFDLEKSSSWSVIFSIIGVVVLVVGVLGIFLIKDTKTPPVKEGYLHCIFYGFKPSTIKGNPLLYILLGAFTVFNISIQIFMPYLIIYYEKSLQMANYVFIMAPAIILASVVTAFWGKVYDKKGFKFSVLLSLLWLSAGYIVLFLTRTTAPVFIGSLLMMCGYLAGMAVFGAMIRDYTPENKAGMFQGLRIFSQVLIPGVVGPMIGAAVLKNAETVVNNDGTTSFLPNENIFLAALVALIALLPIIFIVFKTEKPRFERLNTPFEDEKAEMPWGEYPRPNLKRDSFICLNGKWNLKILRNNKVLKEGEILVPFSLESDISGFEFNKKKNDVLVYSKKFNIDTLKKTILHFGAVDTECTVFVNGKLTGTHIGGYLPFKFDVSEYITSGENTVEVRVIDRLDTELAYGKQCQKRGGMWYTQTSGIWQTVWLEQVPDEYIKSIKITPDLNGVDITVLGGEESKTIICCGKEYSFSGESFRLDVEEPKLWSPEEPNLYEFTLVSGEDRVESYFALRTISINGNDILLNGKPYFFHGLLDQGYFSDGIYMPYSEKGFEKDILTMKELGFNMLRKHIKIEPMIFYYYCDKYGMVVFQDLVNSGKYNFLIDTALPTVLCKKGISHKASKKRREAFIADAKATFELLYNFPSVCYYTIFNEGWGQFDAKNIYRLVKELEPTRVIDATSGWFQTGESDVLSEHIYFKPIKLKNDGRPLVLSEFGGYSYKVEGHSFNTKNTYGYRFFADKEAFNVALEKLYLEEVVPAIKNQKLCATVLTQVSDVEDETNGLFTYDRQVLKVDKNRMQAVSQKLFEAFSQTEKNAD
ncbi:MAG: MFS transporter [Clostridia bacterium]|nr:MFS transporter [Clostridia bacterium]